MGVEGWFEREHSDLRGEAKYHLDWSIFSVASGPIRLRIGRGAARRQRSAASRAMVPQSEDFPRRPKNFPFR